jgi:iron complex transport system ATP-binding protein
LERRFLHGFFSGDEEMLEVKNLSTGYNKTDVIRNISFKVYNGESLCILGPNGSGKSTLLKAIARIIGYRGLVSLAGENDITVFTRKELAKKIALLGQTAQIYFPYTVYETVSMGRYAYSQGFLKSLSAEDKTIIKNILIRLNIWDIKDRLIDELSGGTLQRVFLARTLAQTPDLILLDEPANHLDIKHQIELLDFLKTWIKDNNTILISVLHDLNLARFFGGRAIVMNYGEIAADGTIEEVLESDILSTVYGFDIQAFVQASG